MNMQAAVLTGIRRMELREVPAPELRGDSEVLLRMEAVGVCGSDVHYYDDGRIGSQVVRYPFTVGHEGAGTVLEVGAAVKRVKPGDRVAIDPAMPCWSCDQCAAGRHNTCRRLRFLGCPDEAPGCLSERVVMPETSCFPVPEAMTFEQAAFTEPLSVGIYAVARSVPMEGAAIGILGAGPIGLSVLLAARAAGARVMVVTDKLDQRLEVAVGLGAFSGGNPLRDDVVERIGDLEPGRLDAVFECCGEQDALDDAVELLKPGGKLMIVGIPSVERISFGVDATRRKELCLQNVRRQRDCVQEAIDGIASGTYRVDSLLTHRFTLEDADAAFRLVSGYEDGVVKAMIGFPRA